MKKEQLMKLAEQGVIKRLAEIQLEINELSRAFPHLVQNQNGSVPAVAPITLKESRSKKPNPELSKIRKAYWANMSPEKRARLMKKMIRARNKGRKAKATAATT